MSARERTRSTPREGGYSGAFTWDVPGLPSGSCPQSYTFCGDQTGHEDNFPLIIDSHRWEGGVINKPFDGYWSSWFYDYVADSERGAPEGHLGVDTPGDVYVATKAAAATNPSKPYIDIPVAGVEEYRDTVTRIRRVGEAEIDLMTDLRMRRPAPGGQVQRLANANLHYQFAISPVAQDLARLTRLDHEINKRLVTIDRLLHRGYRRTTRGETFSAPTVTQSRWVQSAGELMAATFTIETSQRVWAHCRWAMAEEHKQLLALKTPPEIRGLAERAVLGLTVDSSTAWRLYPWSWATDWFGTVGAYLSAKRNIIPATLIEVTVMRHAITLASCPSISYKNIYNIPVSMTGINRVRERKSRAYSYISPFAAHMPFLNASQVGIVASLLAGGVNRGGGR